MRKFGDLESAFPAEEVVTTFLYGELTGEIASVEAFYEEDFIAVDGRLLKNYADIIQNQVILSQTELDSERGLAAYIYESPLKQKVKSITVGIEVIDGALYSKTKVESYGAFCEPELSKLKDYLIGQFADGWGEGFEQTGIETGEETLYVHFYPQNLEFTLYTEDELPFFQEQAGGWLGIS